ncbi:hypothetical protein KZP23_13025 [Echinicola marina]|uniref:hypothetical protein n=1 Tax=Echinicola marina TaxID=2859768 RepID=UPI001CF6169E|nr:hypothetical protein [Echinicola marina]UCS91671.1 hypothetical protein KZP23_13025 [Echinicola marina]
MKNLVLLILLIIPLFSCKDDIEPLGIHFNGTYEWTNFAEEDGGWYVHSLVFQDNGDLERWITIRESEYGDDLGYRSIMRGTYELQIKELTVEWDEFHSLEDPEELFAPRAGLVALENASPVTQVGTVEQMDGGGKIAIEFYCNDILSNCIGKTVYTKVD